MERADAARKVKSLTALADDERAPEPEREAARSTATRLREKFEITEEDLEMADPFVFFGHDLNFWKREVDPHLQRAAEEIEKALAAVARASLPRDRVEGFVRIHQAVKHAAEETGYSPYMRIVGPDNRREALKLKSRRNAAVKLYWQQDVEAGLRDAEEFHQEFSPDEPFDRDYRLARAKDQAVFHTALATDMRQDVIERIVGWKREYS